MKHIWKCSECAFFGVHQPCYVLNNLPSRCPEKINARHKVKAKFEQITKEEFVQAMKNMEII